MTICQTRWTGRLRLSSGLFLCGLVALTLSPEPAAAQGWNLFNLFGAPQQQPQQRQRMPSRPAKPRNHAVQRQAPADAGEVAAKVKQHKPGEPEPAHGVAVFGDNFALPLANGLDEAFEDRNDVAVIHKGREWSGLTREASYDWLKTVQDFLNAKPAGAAKLDAAVMIIGLDDDRNITDDGKVLHSDTPEWAAVYARRVTAIMEAFKAKKIPLIWVGLPIVENDDLADHMAALNDIVRDAAGKTGATFVDTWAAFSDEDGDYTATGPDINGQIMRLRASGGLRFTRAGGRKLAHFIEGDLHRLLGQDGEGEPSPATIAPPTATSEKTPGEKAASAAQSPKAPAKPEVGPVITLTTAPSSSDGHLDQPNAARLAQHADTLVEQALVKGTPPTPHPGRADDASWPPK